MMTEREAWTAIADVLETLKQMPPRHNGVTKSGLCEMLWDMCEDGDIDYDTNQRMMDRIQAELDRRPGDNKCFLFKTGLWKPRAELARRFAKECEE